MTPDGGDLLDTVTDLLDRAGVAHALIGAAAMAVHGVSRSTADLDLLTLDRRVLESTFWAPLPAAASAEVRSGDADDPLAGVVRIAAGQDHAVDLVVGRHAWQAGAIARAERVARGHRTIPVVRIDDLILLKLDAGGSQDRWDIEQLLDRPDRETIVASVARRIDTLPPSATTAWHAIVGS